MKSTIPRVAGRGSLPSSDLASPGAFPVPWGQKGMDWDLSHFASDLERTEVERVDSMKEYSRRSGQPVVAVQLDLESAALSYTKWGGQQTAKSGDWLVNNNGEAYTIEADSFAKTYRKVSLGLYEKGQPVWARVATHDGTIQTKEGKTQYKAGDMIVFNELNEKDGYAMSKQKFFELYED